MSDDCDFDPVVVPDRTEEETERKEKKSKHERANPDYEDFPGYEGAAFIGCIEAMPPKTSEVPGEAPEIQFGNLEPLSEGECKTALEEFVASECCYGSKPAKEMQITSCQFISALHYTLETFSENRSTKKKKKPYKGGPVDGPENGVPPLPWDIPCAPEEMFHDDKIKSEVPHTAKVKKCEDCKGHGYETCNICGGSGTAVCNPCRGSGKRTALNDEVENCPFCDGTKIQNCVMCIGSGRIQCEDCEGCGKLKCYIRLKVKFINHDDEYILEKTDLPDHLIANVGGSTLYEETNPMVYPLYNFPVEEMRQKCIEMVQTHATKWPTEYIHCQRQKLRCVPVTEVAYTWDGGNYRFWVYGTERCVYAPDYPQQCCFGCQLL